MAPAPAAAPRRAPPVPRAALTALDQLRKPHAARATAALIAALLSALDLSDATHLSYLTRRLLLGLSVSASSSRHNYTLALSALSRTPHTSPSALLSAAAALYAANGSFPLTHASAPRERALAAVASVAAVVSASPPLPPAAALSALSALRTAVTADAARWALSPAFARVASRVVACVPEPQAPALVDPLLAIVAARPAAPHALHLALDLALRGLLPPNRLRALYPARTGPFSHALLAAFDTGFTTLPSPDFSAPPAPTDAEDHDVPELWRLAVRYAASPAGDAHLPGGVPALWRDVAVAHLVDASRSVEKKLLAVRLLPLVAAHLTTVEHFATVFPRSVAHLIAVSAHSVRARRRSRQAAAAPMRKGRAAQEALTQLHRAACTLGPQLVTLFAAAKPEPPARRSRPLLCAFLLWSARHGICRQLLPGPVLADALAKLDDQDAVALLADTVRELAVPKPGNVLQRPDLFRFLFSLAKTHSVLEKDVFRVVALYSLFKHDAQDTTSEASAVAKFEKLKLGAAEASYGGVLPTPSPPLSAKSARAGFRRLMDFLTASRSDATKDGLVSSCLSAITKAITGVAPNTGLIPRNNPEGDTSLVVHPATVRDLLTNATEKIQWLASRKAMPPLVRSLRIVTQFLALYLLEPRGHESSEGEEAIEKGRETLLGLFEKIEQCVASISESSSPTPNSAEADGNAEEGPLPVEQLTHLLTELCGRDTASCRQIAMMGIETLGPCIDDSVVAVLFDSLDTVMAPGSLAGLENVEENDEEEEKEPDEAQVSDEDVSDEGADDDDENTPRDGTSTEEHKDKSIEGEYKDTDGSIAGSETDENENGDEEMDGVDDSASESGVNVDMDIDEEDPAVLAALDKHLASHLRLIKQQKNAAGMKRRQTERRNAQARRILDVIQAAGTTLRMQLERSSAEESKLPLVFMDLHVRLYEFVFSSNAVNTRFLGHVTNIVEKQMLLPQKHVREKVSDKETGMEIVQRFFDVMQSCSLKRQVPLAEERIVSKSAGWFIGVAEVFSPTSSERFFAVYERILQEMLKPSISVWTPAVFSSFVQKAPSEALRLLPSVLDALRSETISKRKRTTASELILNLATAATQVSESDVSLSQFWTCVEDLLRNTCVAAPLKFWNADGFKNIVQVAALGKQSGLLPHADELVDTILSCLHDLPMQRLERRRLVKMVQRKSMSRKRKERTADDCVDAANEFQPKAAGDQATGKKKKRKLAEQDK